MTGFLRVLPLRAPVVVRMIPRRPPSSPPSAPPVASYRAAWSRTRSLGLGTYSGPAAGSSVLMSVVSFTAVGSSEVLSVMTVRCLRVCYPDGLLPRWACYRDGCCSDGSPAAVGGDHRAGDVGGLRRG